MPRKTLCFVFATLLLISSDSVAQTGISQKFPFLAALVSEKPPKFITYTPSKLDPRNPANNQALLTSEIRKDLETLRPTFDGLVLYGYHEACTPRITAVAKSLKFRSVMLAIWDPKSAAEIDGVIALAKLHEKDFDLAIIVGNEGITFKRYEAEDLQIAAARLRAAIPANIPLTTSEPLVGYEHDFVRNFGDFAAPNLHPVFDNEAALAPVAAKWVHEKAIDLAQRCKKPALVKETGFPHAGKPAYTPATQREFWQAYRTADALQKSSVEGAWSFHGVAFEAFDLPWKSEASGLEIEKSWGLFTNDRKAHPALEIWK
jgi:exo-beta-1,3-glucanase (GH17 family)